MKTSLKHLLRTPVKTTLFFLLMTAAALLLTVGAVMATESTQRIQAAEEQFHTLGRIWQEPVSVSEEAHSVYSAHNGLEGYGFTETYDDPVDINVLNYEGAPYLVEPENRPYYWMYNEHLTNPWWELSGDNRYFVFEFIPLEEYDGESPIIEVEVGRILFDSQNSGKILDHMKEKNFIEGGHVYLQVNFALERAMEKLPLEPGKRYIGGFYKDIYICDTHKVFEFVLFVGPFSSQHNADGSLKESESTVMGDSRSDSYYEEVTDGFYESERGRQWLEWVDISQQRTKWFPILPTSSLEVLPTFHTKDAYITRGRAITEEEFESGAKVCMVPEDFGQRNLLTPGSKITLSLYMSLYGYPEVGRSITAQSESVGWTFSGSFSPVDAEGDLYEPFWEEEYEVVGYYKVNGSDSKSYIWYTDTEVGGTVIIIPSKSVEASDENNIAYFNHVNHSNASFLIENGTIAEFDAALHAAVPEAEKLTITYDDGGYSEVMGTLRAAQNSALLLLSIGFAAALAVILLLLFFFVVKQKKRTVIERSLGATKHQCRVSILSGLMVLTLLAVMLGTALGGVLLHLPEPVEETVQEGLHGFSTAYSIWAANANTLTLDESGVGAPAWLYGAVPLVMELAVLILSLVFVESNLRVEPIQLLSAREE